MNNLKTFIRHLRKNKLYTIVTIFGFSISLTFVILLSIYVKNEYAVNSQHIYKNRIFRLRNENTADFAAPIGQLLQDAIPEIESYTRVYDSDGIFDGGNDKKSKFDYLLADSSFFTIFSFSFIDGNKSAVLEKKNSVVLTEEFSRRMYGSISPVGKRIKLEGNIDCIVTGVVKDISKNTGFKKIDAIVNFKMLPEIWGWPEALTNFGNSSYDLYLLEKTNSDLQSKAPFMLELLKEHFWVYKDERAKKVIVEPLSEVYFSPIAGEGIKQNSRSMLSILMAIVISILLLSIINYVNLTIAQSTLRVKETAIKKLIGSTKKSLILQQIEESILLCSVAFILAVLSGFIAQVFVNKLLNTRINLLQELNLKTVIISFFLIGLIAIISGIIPALVITRSNAIELIKGKFRKKKAVYSKMLISFQYVVVVVLIIATLVITKQSVFIQKYDIGFNTENILSYDCLIKPEQKEGFRNKIEAIPGVKNISFVAGHPVGGGNNQSWISKGKPVSFTEYLVDTAFFNMMTMTIHKTGVAYSKKGMWINQAAVKTLELDSLPQSFSRYDEPVPVLGVLEDFNFGSLHTQIGPVMIGQLSPKVYPWNILIQINGKSMVETIDKVNKAYDEFVGGTPFEYSFLDESIQNWYVKEKRTSKVVSYFTLLSIIIAVMGIFAMSLFYIQQKIKEVGIRKVNGAKIFEVMTLLNKGLLKWVVIAFVSACPLAWYAMNKWLETFAYKTELSWWIFALAGIITLSIALLTISWQTWRAARRNPVEALRYE